MGRHADNVLPVSMSGGIRNSCGGCLQLGNIHAGVHQFCHWILRIDIWEANIFIFIYRHSYPPAPFMGRLRGQFFCFASARVKVKHHAYDPIGAWGKYAQNVKRGTAAHDGAVLTISHPTWSTRIMSRLHCHLVVKESNVQPLLTNIAPLVPTQLIEICVLV